MMKTAGTILSATGLKKSYPSGDGRIEVLRGVDLDVDPGASISIRGESGCGKSTLLHLLAGLDAPDAGSLLWRGTPASGGRRRAEFVGLVFQSFYLVPEINALANVLLARRFVGPPGNDDRRRASELIDRVGLKARATHLPAQLSGGERQRVALARALMNAPAVILADEPTGNLDERTGDSVIELLLGLCRELQTALILVTHNPAYAARTARHLLLHEGLLVSA